MLGPMTIGAVSSGAGAAARPYAQILRDDYGADEVWPLVDIESGTAIHAHVNGNRDGTLSGWALQNAAGPVPGTLAPLSDGVDDYGDILTSNGTDGLVDIATLAIGSVFFWVKVSDASVWTDGVVRMFFTVLFGGTDRMIQMRKDSADNAVGWIYNVPVGGGVTKSVTLSTTDWFSMGLSYQDDANGGAVRFFIDGVEQTPAATQANTFAGQALSKALIGAWLTTGSLVHSGWESYVAVKFGSIWTPTDFSNMHAAAAEAAPENP